MEHLMRMLSATVLEAPRTQQKVYGSGELLLMTIGQSGRYEKGQ